MKSFDNYPKSVKKTLRYIKQDAHLAQLNNLEKIFLQCINFRKKALENKELTSKLNNEFPTPKS
ncbi:hypothetical protein [Priestia filamentosa]|uniref:hypothetical protein n=1 Tax=Priestia filamentosa TaxID=1402861 RepID=UPI001C1E494C|nr:hypothetical protein [Priestia filamentosa]